MKWLLVRYMGEPGGWDSRFVETLGDADYIFTRIEPETVMVRDQSYKLSGGGRT